MRFVESCDYVARREKSWDTRRVESDFSRWSAACSCDQERLDVAAAAVCRSGHGCSSSPVSSGAYNKMTAHSSWHIIQLCVAMRRELREPRRGETTI